MDKHPYFSQALGDTMAIGTSSIFSKDPRELNYFFQFLSLPMTLALFCLTNSYINEFESGISTWKQNKVLGGGIKSYYYNCAKRNKINSNLPGCSSHPHNYYIQIAAELGLVGLALAIIIFSIMDYYWCHIKIVVIICFNYFIFI